MARLDSQYTNGITEHPAYGGFSTQQLIDSVEKLKSMQRETYNKLRATMIAEYQEVIRERLGQDS